jgi:hypothetical protein
MTASIATRGEVFVGEQLNDQKETPKKGLGVYLQDQAAT